MGTVESRIEGVRERLMTVEDLLTGFDPHSRTMEQVAVQCPSDAAAAQGAASDADSELSEDEQRQQRPADL